MTEIIWNTQELLQYCPEQVTNKAKIYFKAVQDKIARILYAVERINNYQSSLPSLISFPDFRKKQLEIVMDLETIAYNLHSLPDVLANIITILIINPLIFTDTSLCFKRDKDINIYSVKDKINVIQTAEYINIQQKQHLENLVAAIEKLIKSSEYEYISALVNTIKHRNLIDTEYIEKISISKFIYLNSSTPSQNMDDANLNTNWTLIEFEKDNNNYPAITIEQLITKYRENIINLFFLVGQEINNYCLATRISNSST
ncbi:hypothetical protein NIES22_70460 (plasmid) [Calothrix brevissima NIES-22]|nr:hypothetical protein NIES22_70460 [Calothrix brevissima NIES-22]